MLATRKKPVDGYLLKQSVPKPSSSSSSSKKAKHQEQAGLFRKLFFSLDRDAGVLLYYTSQQEHANASSSAASSSSSGGPEGSIPLLDIEFVEELAKERPARELLLQAEPTKKDKKDKSGEHGAASEEPLPRNAWQWPFVIHTTSLGTHLILAPTAEVRDNWVVNLEEAIAETKLRARKSKSKSQRLDDPNGRLRSESEVQADFLDILVFDSYVHELRKKEKTPEEAAESVSPRNATYHSMPPLSPLNLKPPPKVPSPTSSRSPRYGDINSPRPPSEAAQAQRPEAERLTQSQSSHQRALARPSAPPATKESHGEGGGETGSEIGSPGAKRKGSRSQTVWRKEERKGNAGALGGGTDTPPKRRIGVRERVDSNNSSSVDAETSGTRPIRKTTSEETVMTAKSSLAAQHQEETTKATPTPTTVEPKSENEGESDAETAKDRAQVPKRLSAGKRMYHTEEHAEGGGGSGFGLSLHRRNLSMDFQTIVQASAAEAAATAENENEIQKKNEDEMTLKGEAKNNTEKSEESPPQQQQRVDEPVQLRENVARRLAHAKAKLSREAADDDSSESSESESAAADSEFVEQMHFMQRRLSVIYKRMNDMEGDFFAQQQPPHTTEPHTEPLNESSSPDRPRKTRKKQLASNNTATATLLRKEDQQAVRKDQEMLQAVVRREAVCRRLHKLVDNPMDHDVQFLISRDTSTRRIIYGHRAIIRTRSSFFDKLFTQTSASGMDPKGPYVIPETTREAFIEVLSYLYSGNMSLTVDNVQDVYKAAATLRMKEMKAACRQFASRNAVTLPPRPTSSPYHVAKRQSVMDLFKNVNFEEARAAALASCPQHEPQGVSAVASTPAPAPAANTTDDGAGGEDSPKSGGKSRSKRMSQGLARVKSVLSIVSPRSSQLVASQGDDQPSTPTSSVEDEREGKNENESESEGGSAEEDKLRTSGGLKGSFFSRSGNHSKTKRTTKDS
ncbi:PH domain containing protein [Acanthamoeba castellanii str. Neff]|uniref:PH domain containing protein n=1 Tax=Acanthamoeba castellanii (strain ATCC 30010 / Neff) TaxID=1257118 RepID=L8GCF4_ACACF|nr:PH domain containing protein [Acanthamoeba castellanii str. Neff]ELR10885.1 PH domain containing protein [Acanthamoeba castellanii str. Neff]